MRSLTIPSPTYWYTKSVDIRKVLEDDTCWSEWYLHILSLGLLPVKDPFHVWGLYQKPIAVTHRGLQENPDGEWQTFWKNKQVVIKPRKYILKQQQMFIFTISAISKFGKVVKLLIWVVRIQWLNDVLIRIILSCRHFSWISVWP